MTDTYILGMGTHSHILLDTDIFVYRIKIPLQSLTRVDFRPGTLNYKSQTRNSYYRKQHTSDHQDYTDSCSCGIHWQSTPLVRVIISFFRLWYKFVLRSSQIKKSGSVIGSPRHLQIGFGQSVHPRGHLSRHGHQL